ncbi:hypothetical protein JEQ12_010617 [Ovis aries]|uniref:Uridylate-specific endoribonuclease n=1 Tax=Ovis aries TaxID=9940 RepID=A0A835ZVH1_SHEEP|nr:hypothetical protein JEQ12_010617 [Ovis aries]
MSTGSIVHSVGSTLVKKQNIRGTLSGSQTLIFNISWKIVCLKNNLWEEKENLDLCGNNLLDHFLCELPAMVKIACIDTTAVEMSVFALGIVIVLTPLILILISYGYIAKAVLRMKSKAGQRKAVNTCGSHLTVVSIFYGAIIYLYLQPGNNASKEQGIVIVLTPLILILISYGYIAKAVLRMKSKAGQRKAVNTCGSHLTVVSIFYGTIIYMYLQPGNNASKDRAEENPIEPEPFLELEEETEGAPASSLYLAPNSCQGCCLEAFDKHHPCYCNAHCPEFGNCCEDFESLCGHEGCSHSSDAINKEELQSVSEKIYRADTNKARKEDIVLNSQNCILPSETRDQVDHCPEPLFTYVNKKLFSKPTYTAFINLLNNYQRATGRGEHFTAQELAEQDTFLREIMKTDVMKELYGFLHQQNCYSSGQEFVSDLRNMWFGLYSRSKEERD